MSAISASAFVFEEKYGDEPRLPTFEEATALDEYTTSHLESERSRLLSAVSELDRLRVEMEAKIRTEMEAKIRMEILKEVEAKEVAEKRRREEEMERLRVLREKNMAKIPDIIEYLQNASMRSGGTTFPSQHDKVTTALTKWMDTLESEYIGSYAIWAHACDNGTLDVHSNTYLITTVGIYYMYFSARNTVIMHDVTIQHIYQFDTSLSGTIMEKMLLAYPPTYIWWSNVIGNMNDTTWSEAIPRFLSLVHAIPGTKMK